MKRGKFSAGVSFNRVPHPGDRGLDGGRVSVGLLTNASQGNSPRILFSRSAILFRLGNSLDQTGDADNMASQFDDRFCDFGILKLSDVDFVQRGLGFYKFFTAETRRDIYHRADRFVAHTRPSFINQLYRVVGDESVILNVISLLARRNVVDSRYSTRAN